MWLYVTNYMNESRARQHIKKYPSSKTNRYALSCSSSSRTISQDFGVWTTTETSPSRTESSHLNIAVCHLWMSHVAYVNESCLSRTRSAKNVWRNHYRGLSRSRPPFMNESCCIYEWVMSLTNSQRKNVWRNHYRGLSRSRPPPESATRCYTCIYRYVDIYRYILNVRPGY